mmetsp:Transcript_16427/g.55457  ORF Transcript_16427/g.55457 Transcript_16427/m.55457 type:complete len:240 (-) Transcript_16427:290-1009(-)
MRSGASCPAVSTLKRKWSATRRSCTWSFMSAPNSSSSIVRMHSRHMVQSRGRAAIARRQPPGTSSMSKTFMGHRFTSASARASTTSSLRSIFGIILYAAVATGDHLACVRAMPLHACASKAMDCPGRSLAMRISGWTGLTGRSSRKVSCSPWGSQQMSLELTGVVCRAGLGRPCSAARRASSGSTFGARTSRPKTIVFASVASSGSWRSSKSFGSAKIGIRPRRCARTSSCMTLEFSST